MSELICNLPAQQVWVRKEYLRDLKDGHGEFVKGVWVTAKSMACLLYTSPSPRDRQKSRMPSSA